MSDYEQEVADAAAPASVTLWVNAKGNRQWRIRVPACGPSSPEMSAASAVARAIDAELAAAYRLDGPATPAEEDDDEEIPF